MFPEKEKMEFERRQKENVDAWKRVMDAWQKEVEGSDKMEYTKENAKLKITNHIRNMFKDVIPNEEWRNGFVGFADAPKPNVQGWYNLYNRDIHIANETIMFENVFLFYYLMVHEYTHLINHEFGVEDVVKDGWHNELYRDSIKNLFDVNVSIDGKYGYQKFDVKQGDFYTKFARWYDLNKLIWDEIRELFYKYVKVESIPQEKTLGEQGDEFDDKMDDVEQPDNEDNGENPNDSKEEKKKKGKYEVDEEGGVDLV